MPVPDAMREELELGILYLADEGFERAVKDGLHDALVGVGGAGLV